MNTLEAIPGDHLHLIRQSYENFSETERKIADYLLSHPALTALPNISELAAASGTSISSIVRFCKTMGFNGYSEFRYDCQRRAAAPLGGSVKLDSSDSIESLKAKVSSFSRKVIHQAITTPDDAAMESAIVALSYARRIIICGEGNAAGVSTMAANTFMLLGIPSFYIPDPLLQLRSVSFLEKNDVVIGITNDGHIKDVVDVLCIAQKRHATTICITGRKDSLATKYSDICLYTTLQDDQSLLDLPITSVCQLMVLYTLQIGLIARNAKASQDYIHSLQMLSECKRYDTSLTEIQEGRIR